MSRWTTTEMPKICDHSLHFCVTSCVATGTLYNTTKAYICAVIFILSHKITR